VGRPAAAGARRSSPCLRPPRTTTVSRIVPQPQREGPGWSLPEADVHYVVTEYGMAYLHGKSIRERTLELISIAHPKFRKELIQHAKQRQVHVYQDQIEMSWEEIRAIPRNAGAVRNAARRHRDVLPAGQADGRAGAVGNALLAESSDSVHSRFFTHTMTFPHRDVQQLTNIDYDKNLAIVGVVPGACRAMRRSSRSPSTSSIRRINAGGSRVHRAGRVAAQGHGHVRC
jgi:hypothetical protein